MFIQPASQATDSLQFKVLCGEPIDDTYKSVYRGIEEILDTDSRLNLIVELQGSSQKEYILKVQIFNSNSDCSFDEQKKVTQRTDREKPYIQHSIDLNNELKSKLGSGLITVRLEVNGKPYPAKQLIYYGHSNFQKNTGKLVLLPFCSKKHQYFDWRARFTILNTFPDALKCELQRYFSDVVPAEISKGKASNDDINDCFDDRKCNNIKTNFGEGLFIVGNVSLPPADNSYQSADRECFLEIFIFDSKRNEFKKYKSSFPIREGDNPILIMKSLLDDILVKQGMLLYIRSL